jgi:haloalkane dehalogenase
VVTAELPAPPLPDWLARMLPFRRYQVEVDRYRLAVMESGQGFPVLALHGNPTWGFLYRKVALALSRDPVRVIMPDLLGLGFSDRIPAAAHTLDHHGEVIGKLIDRVAPEPLLFVGQDWGGPIGLRALAERKSLLAGLVLMNTVAGPPREDFRPTTFHQVARLPIVSDLLFRGLGFPQNLLDRVQGDRSSIQGEVARAYRYPLRGLSRNAAPLALARMVPDSQTHPTIAALRVCQQLVEQFRGPAALVWGERDPILGRVIGWMEQLLPQAQVTRTQAGHFLQEEVPEEIARAIRGVVAACA